jgi:hypothetical protein
LGAGETLSLNITGPSYPQAQFTVTFSANGATQSLSIPCVDSNK